MSIKEANKKIEETVVGAYKAVESGVVGTYKKVEDGVVGTYKKVEDKFVESFLAKDGETAEEAKERLKSEQKQDNRAVHASIGKNITEASKQISSDIAKASVERSKNAGKI